MNTTSENTRKSIDDVLRKDSRPPILYLRDFNSDSEGINFSIQGIPFKNLVSYDQVALGSLQMFGPTIAIGNPRTGENMRSTAVDFYQDNEWQQRVLELMAKASIIVVRTPTPNASRSEGVIWEIEQIVRAGYLDKTIIYTEFGHIHEDVLFEVWMKKLSHRLIHLIPNLPAYNKNKKFIYFINGEPYQASTVNDIHYVKNARNELLKTPAARRRMVQTVIPIIFAVIAYLLDASGELIFVCFLVGIFINIVWYSIANEKGPPTN